MREKIVIIGASGHAKVIIDIIRSSGTYDIVGCTDAVFDNMRIMDLPIIGNDSILPELLDNGVRHAFVAIGDNKKRENICQTVSDLGYSLVNAVSPVSYLSPTVKMGCGIAIMPRAVINADTTVESGSIINTGATIDHDCSIGEYVHIAPGCNLAGNVKVERGASLGIGCQAIPKIRVGEGSIVGAGSVIVRDIPPYTLAYGVPARLIKKL